MRYVYASEKETIRCRRELLQRSREERSAIDLSAVIDDDSVFGAELVNDVRSCQRDRVRRRNVGDDGHGIHRAAGRGLCHAGAILVPPMPTEDDCEFMSSLPEPDDITSGCDVLCKDTTLHFEQEGEEQEAIRKERSTFSIACAIGCGMRASRSASEGVAPVTWRVGVRCAIAESVTA